jgi:hypothetical protein
VILQRLVRCEVVGQGSDASGDSPRFKIGATRNWSGLYGGGCGWRRFDAEAFQATMGEKWGIV